jgi:hypothetical protein
MADKEYEVKSEKDSISKPTLTTEAGPDSASPNASTTLNAIKDLDHYKPQGAPATNKEVWSYYAYYAGNNGIGSFQ